jgi:hypothetical protein
MMMKHDIFLKRNRYYSICENMLRHVVRKDGEVLRDGLKIEWLVWPIMGVVW